MEGRIRRSSGVDDEDPFPIRSRSRSPSRLAAPAMQDRDSLLAVYTCTGGGSWRTSLGWPNFGGISRQASLGRRSIVSPPTAKPSASQNPFREGVIFSDGDGEHRAKASAPKYVGVDCPTPPRSDGCGSPGNPFARAEVEAAPKPKSKNPFAPETPTTTASSHEVTAAHVLQTPPPLTSPEKRRSSPLDAAADLGGLRSRRRSPSPTADISGRSAFLGSPGQRKSLEAGAGAAWFGVSLGPAARVTELKLVDNGLIGTLPSALGGLEMLRYLHLGRNALSGTIPIGISSLVNLEWLNLSENFLTGPVPATLSSHTRLVELNLSANRLSGPFPQELCGLARLVSLQLSHNDLEGFLPVEMCKLCELVTLCLDHNRFCGPIPLGVSAMKGLKELRLDNNELTGRIPLGVGKMKSLQVLSLSNNLLRGSMPEGLISKLGATKVQKFIMPGNRLADVDTAMLLLRRPLQCTADRGLLVFSLVAAYVDLGSDVGAAVTFYLGSDVLSFILAIIFIVVPTSVMVATTMGAARGRDRNKKILLTVFQLRLVWEARDGLAKRRETRDYKTAKFVEACFEAAPQMLLQTVALASLWNENQAKTSDVFVAFSIINSVFSVSWETMSALDRGWAEEMVEERARRGTSWPCGASAHRWLVLLCLWVFHLCEVGLRGLSLALLALALQGWAVLVMLGVWGVRIAVARATEASDLKWTKVLIKALAACLLDSIWDSRPAYIIASICTLMESSMFFVVAAKELRGADDDSPLGEAVSDAAWTAGSVYAVRCALDVWLRAPLHWGGVYGGGLSACSWWGSASARLRGALGTAPSEIGRAEPMPLPSAILSTPMATPAPVPNGRQ